MRLAVYAFEGLLLTVGGYVFLVYYALPFFVEWRNKTNKKQ